LRVPEDLSVMQDVFLPAEAESNLHQVMTYELDRYTPFNAGQVYFGFIKLGPANNKALIHLLLILVKKDSPEHDKQRFFIRLLTQFFR
jgi:general secretion pathway protein L